MGHCWSSSGSSLLVFLWFCRNGFIIKQSNYYCGFEDCPQLRFMRLEWMVWWWISWCHREIEGKHDCWAFSPLYTVQCGRCYLERWTLIFIYFLIFSHLFIALDFKKYYVFHFVGQRLNAVVNSLNHSYHLSCAWHKSFRFQSSYFLKMIWCFIWWKDEVCYIALFCGKNGVCFCLNVVLE